SSPWRFSAWGRGRGRAAGRPARRESASLSNAAGAHQFGHPPEKVGVDRRVPGLNADKSEPRHLRLLRARREWPRRCTAKQCDELAPPHSITSSASVSRLSEILRPSALAVVRLMTRSNLVGCSIGSSPGFAPRKILST